MHVFLDFIHMGMSDINALFLTKGNIYFVYLTATLCCSNMGHSFVVFKFAPLDLMEACSVLG